MNLDDDSREVMHPFVRHSCQSCSYVTLAPRGENRVTCEGCGQTVDSCYALDLIVADLAASGGYQLLLSAEAPEDTARDYARLDAAIFFLMNKLPLELAVERRGAGR